MDEEYARKLHEDLNKDIYWDVAINHVKQKAKEDPAVQRYQTKEQIEEEENRAIQSINETPAQKVAKRRKLNEEVKDLKKNLEIVPNEDDDVYTEATPLARKVPVVDYGIIYLNNKPHYKIIRADGTHQLYISLTVEERFTFNVSLRMFTRSIVIQRRVEDLQLGVESYQKRLNLTKPDMYRSDLKRKEAYIAYSNPRGFIYQNKDKKNRLMRIDKLHKFSDGTLNDVRNALDDRLKGSGEKVIRTEQWP
nr:hypothetical protein [Tanacetum cinerariifolium]